MTRKLDSERQRTNTPALADVIPLGVNVIAPEHPEHWLAETVTEWERWWDSPAARLIDPDSETAIVVRMFDVLDQAAGFEAMGRAEPVVSGSTGQATLNPLLKHAQSLRDEARRDEAVLGRGPKRRLDLGVKFGEASKSIDDMNRRLARGNNDSPAPVEDPRLAAHEATAREA